MPPFVRMITAAVAGYAALTGVLYVSQRRLMYHPDPTVPDRAAAGVPDMDEVLVTTADGLSLLAWYRPAADPARPTVLYLHGNAGHIGYRGAKMRALIDAGYGALLLAWRGFSGNPGEPSERGLYADARGALDFLAANGVPSRRVVLYGESLGSGVAVHVAGERDIAGVILEAPFTSIADVAQHHYWYVPVRPLVIDRFESQTKIARIEAPLLIVHGANDNVVPVRHGRALYASAREPKHMVEFASAGHSDLYDHGAAVTVREFLDRLTP